MKRISAWFDCCLKRPLAGAVGRWVPKWHGFARSGDAQTEELFRLAVEAAPNGIVMVDERGRIVLVNAETERLFGYTRDELLGRSVEILVPSRFGEIHPSHRAHYQHEPEARRMGAGRDLYGRRKDGSEFPVEIGLNPIQTRQGLRVMSVIVDITERKQAEEKFRLAVEASPNGVVMVNESGEIVLVNAETERLFGYDRSELLGKSVELLVPARFRGGHPSHRGHYHHAPQARRMGEGRDLYGRRKDGSEFPVEIGLNPIRMREGMFVLSVIIDISERKRSEESLAAQARELQRSNAELEQFAYVASHDLQEPLRMVASYTELLSQRYQGKLDEKADKYIWYAVDGARRMQVLVNDLLSYSRVGTQGKPLMPTDAGAVLDNVLVRLSKSIRETGANIERDALPQVLADEIQLGQVFQNLIGNAIKFRSERPPEIRVSARLEKEGWIFSVSDNGIGMDLKYADRIFQMFQRLHGMGEYSGSGIGLALVKKIVERHQGHVWVESEQGKGSTFSFVLLPATASLEDA